MGVSTPVTGVWSGLEVERLLEVDSPETDLGRRTPNILGGATEWAGADWSDNGEGKEGETGSRNESGRGNCGPVRLDR